MVRPTRRDQWVRPTTPAATRRLHGEGPFQVISVDPPHCTCPYADGAGRGAGHTSYCFKPKAERLHANVVRLQLPHGEGYWLDTELEVVQPPESRSGTRISIPSPPVPAGNRAPGLFRAGQRVVLVPSAPIPARHGLVIGRVYTVRGTRAPTCTCEQRHVPQRDWPRRHPNPDCELRRFEGARQAVSLEEVGGVFPDFALSPIS
jgi:hypothetical protein